MTDWARDILARSLSAARRFDPAVVIRIVARGAGVEAILAEAPDDDDEKTPIDDVWVAPDIDGLLDAQEPHSQLVLRPAGSTPNERPHE
jgi:hypothetical protein